MESRGYWCPSPRYRLIDTSRGIVKIKVGIVKKERLFAKIEGKVGTFKNCQIGYQLVKIKEGIKQFMEFIDARNYHWKKKRLSLELFLSYKYYTYTERYQLQSVKMQLLPQRLACSPFRVLPELVGPNAHSVFPLQTDTIVR